MIADAHTCSQPQCNNINCGLWLCLQEMLGYLAL